MTESAKVRIDKWLWAARFFKTRSLATKAVNGGKVHLNEARVKSARMVSVGDNLVINKGQQEFEVIVLGISDRRGPAPQARLLYEETEESLKNRTEQAELRRMTYAGQTSPEKRPSKRDRRKIRDFIRKQ